VNRAPESPTQEALEACIQALAHFAVDVVDLEDQLADTKGAARRPLVVRRRAALEGYSRAKSELGKATQAAINAGERFDWRIRLEHTWTPEHQERKYQEVLEKHRIDEARRRRMAQ